MKYPLHQCDGVQTQLMSDVEAQYPLHQGGGCVRMSRGTDCGIENMWRFEQLLLQGVESLPGAAPSLVEQSTVVNGSLWISKRKCAVGENVCGVLVSARIPFLENAALFDFKK